VSDLEQSGRESFDELRSYNPEPTKLDDWFKQRAQTNLDEHVRPEIQALVKRGNITTAEVASLSCNSWEWEHLIPAMNDEAFVVRMEYALARCGVHKRPFVTYNEAVEGLYAPELLKRFKLAAHEARVYADTIDAVREMLGQKSTHYLVMAGDVMELVEAIEHCNADDGCHAMEVLRRLREEGK
jgi:hypothetical protein